MSKYTTKRELLEMLEEVSDDAPIILKVRGSSSRDYETDMKVVAFENDNGVLIIEDRLSY